MLLNRFMFRRCELVIYVSHKQREYWRARGLRVKRDIVIQNGIDADYFTDRSTAQQKAATRAEFGFAPSDFVIGICAALRAEKAHGDLLQALRRLRDSGVHAKVLIIGDGPRRGEIERQIAELELTGHAVIAGHRDDVRPYIACCDVMTLTSHVVETFSIAALESMALGKPMVLTRIGGAEEQVRHGTNGFLYERGDVATLAHLLRRLTAATDRLSMGAVAARDVRERFTIQRMIERFTEELQRVAEPTGDRDGDMSNAMRVLMLGPDLQVRGGVAAVENALIASLPPEIQVTQLPTMVEGSKWRKLATFAAAIVRTIASCGAGPTSSTFISRAARAACARCCWPGWHWHQARA